MPWFVKHLSFGERTILCLKKDLGKSQGTSFVHGLCEKMELRIGLAIMALRLGELQFMHN